MLLATNYINEKEESSILEDRVKDALFRINRGLPQEVLEEAYRQIITFNSPLLTENNRHFHKLLTEGMEVTYKEKEAIRTKRAYIVDFEKDNKDNNEFLVVNQFTIVEKEERRPDLIIFINGIPLVVIELKSASDENVGIESAYNQIQTYKKDTPSLFNYNAFCVLSDGINAKAGTITSNAKRMKDNADELKIVIVRDMWLTGFDVPSMHTMYIDKPMQGHNLIQTISRVNRVLN